MNIQQNGNTSAARPLPRKKTLTAVEITHHGFFFSPAADGPAKNSANTVRVENGADGRTVLRFGSE